MITAAIMIMMSMMSTWKAFLARPRLMIGLTCFEIQLHDCQSYATAGSSDNLVEKFLKQNP